LPEPETHDSYNTCSPTSKCQPKEQSAQTLNCNWFLARVGKCELVEHQHVQHESVGCCCDLQNCHGLLPLAIRTDEANTTSTNNEAASIFMCAFLTEL
jgi:hypothetical protein